MNMNKSSQLLKNIILDNKLQFIAKHFKSTNYETCAICHSFLFLFKFLYVSKQSKIIGP